MLLLLGCCERGCERGRTPSPSTPCFQFFLVFLVKASFPALHGLRDWDGFRRWTGQGIGWGPPVLLTLRWEQLGLGVGAETPRCLPCWASAHSPVPPPHDPAEPRPPTQVLWCPQEGVSGVWGGAFCCPGPLPPGMTPSSGVRCWGPRLRPHLDGGWCRMCAETVWLWRRGRRGSAQGGTALGQQDMQGTASEMRESLSPAPTWLGPHLAQRLCWERGRWGQSGWLPPPGAVRAVEVFPEPKPREPALENVGFNQAKTGS